MVAFDLTGIHSSQHTSHAQAEKLMVLPAPRPGMH